MTITKRGIAEFQSTIFHWWKTYKRDLPWRHTRDPYKIAVSEIMLQQTQVLRVLPKYAEFIEAWPNVLSLAKASVGDVLRVWRGMGYNRRALYLQKMAKIIIEDFGGKFPKDEQLLVKLPGLGTYTARAILVFAYGENIACVDTNIRQIITHFFFDDKEQSPQIIQAAADKLVPKGKSWEWHQALMDYGSLELKKIRPPMRRAERKQIPFRQTNRFYRGRVMDLLRKRTYMKKDLFHTLQMNYGKNTLYYSDLVEKLKNEGLLVVNIGTVSLP